MRHKTLTFSFFAIMLIGNIAVHAQQQGGSLRGRVFNPDNNESVPFANMIIYGTNTGSITDIDGNFVFYGLKPGYVQVAVSAVGFEQALTKEILITNATTPYLEIELRPSSLQLETVVIKASPFRKREESPVSMRSIGIKEIEKNPGGNRDISKVIQSFPGVASTPAFRNDIIVRGGGANENRFFLDGVEIPNINHFATQGASGGPVGIINVDFVREVDFYAGAFPANRGNALSSVLDFRQIDGNKDKLKYRATIGASDLALTLDGPLSDNNSFVFSVRRSYLQLLFATIGLPFLPTYNDAQFKNRIRINDKSEITFIGLGAFDTNALNLDANETESQRYILKYLPSNDQWNYTLGAVYKYFMKNGYQTVVLSRNHLNNVSEKYRENIELPENKTFDYVSNEIETKLRYENVIRTNDWKFLFGAGGEYNEYTNDTYNKIVINNQPLDLKYNTNLNFVSYSAFGQISRNLLQSRLLLSFGLRFDGNSYSSVMANPLPQSSPRLSASYNLTPELSLNMNVGRYYQRPAYTTMGFRNSEGALINKENGLEYIHADQFVLGIESQPNEKSRITLEGFYKIYGKYPFSVNDSVAISSKSADFDIFGAEEVVPIGEGRAYGLEFLIRHNDLWGFNLITSLSLVRSEFENFAGEYIPTAWDNKILFNVTATRKLPHNWDVGFKWRFVGGAPYTPVDLERSRMRTAYDVTGTTYLDYTNFNSERLTAFHQLDLRIDKQFFFKKWSLMLYFDVQNAYGFKSQRPDQYINEDPNGNVIIENPSAPLEQQRYVLRKLENTGQGTTLPSVGIMIEF
ncbi:MAG: TonB-dependent receptor [Salinivirgaceae bacterium]|nr:TonB-dependent receptor [Salinivirgaceae bacterium]